MITLLKNCHVYAPADLGCQDMLLAGGKIVKIAPGIDVTGLGDGVEVLEVGGASVVPGFIDQHVHLIGGGGEGSFHTRTPEVVLTDLTLGGTTSVVGVLGTDDITRSMEALYAKAKGLEEEGLSTWIYSGAYPIPTPTLTGSVRRDLVIIDKVIGTGEIAMSDHRNSAQTKEDFAKLAAEARVGGILSGKAGVLHIHVGPGPRKLQWLFEILAETDLPIANFTPTHCNRESGLLAEAIKFSQLGGMIDFTSSSPIIAPTRVQAPDAVKVAVAAGVPVGQMTMSSDGNGSMPRFDEHNNYIGLTAAEPKTLHACLREIVQRGILPLEEALKLITVNVATSLKLPHKGQLAEDFDADVVILDADYQVQAVFAKGRQMVKDGVALVKGTFEK
ncbi:MAG: beta-aspartyl-peptidase [Acidaminococcaceae bacterium]